MARLEDQYAKPKPGESASQKAARQKKYYSAQRESAQERGDQGTVNKIYGKLGRQAPNVDTERGNKAILAAVPAVAGGGVGLSRILGTVAAREAGSALAPIGAKLAQTAGKTARGFARNVPNEQKALSAGRKALPAARKALSAPKSSVPRSNLSATAQRQAGKTKLDAPKTQRRADNYVRSKTGSTNREAAGMKKSKK